MRRKDSKKRYADLIAGKGYDAAAVELKFHQLKVDTTQYDLFQVKSAIVYLSRFESELDHIIDLANHDVLRILNAATVKEERSGD